MTSYKVLGDLKAAYGILTHWITAGEAIRGTSRIYGPWKYFGFPEENPQCYKENKKNDYRELVFSTRFPGRRPKGSSSVYQLNLENMQAHLDAF